MAMAEVTVLGAGIFGLSVAWECQRRGARVRVIDPAGTGRGASGGPVGALAPHVPEDWNPKKQFQLESLLMAEAWWREIEEISGSDPGYARTGRLQPVEDDRALALARARIATAEALWQGEARWEVIRTSAAGDWAPESPTGWLVRDTLSARLHPPRACAALAAAIRRRGGTLEAEGPHRGAVVHATGWRGFDALNAAHGRLVGAGVKGQAALLDHAAPEAPQLFTGGLHIVPHMDGTTAIGSTSERDFTDPEAPDAQLDEVIARARQAVPALADAPVLRRWSGVRPRARSRAPMLGRHPLHPEEFIANGGFKIGFGMAPRAAQVMARLILEGRDEIPPAFRPEASLPKDAQP